MKIIRYQDPKGKIGYASQQPDGSALKIEGDIFGHPKTTHTKADVKKVLAPVVPVTILGIGLNYRQHAAETGSPIPANPILFLKNVAAVQDPDEPILLPSQLLKSTEVDFEAELAVVIGKRCKNVARGHALEYVLGYTCANDVSARDWQGKWGGSRWSRKDVRHVRPPRPLSCDHGRHPESQHAGDSRDSKRADHAEFEHGRHDFRCSRPHRLRSSLGTSTRACNWTPN